MRNIVSVLFAVGLVACIHETHQSSPEITLAAAVGTPAFAKTMAPMVPDRWTACPAGMIEVEGEYCPNLEEVCLEWVDATGKATKAAIPKPGGGGRCGTFKKPSVCRGKTIHKSFCIDRFEYPNVEGQVPQSWMTWETVKLSCEADGKRLCTKSEWTFSCEGPEGHPYPYGDGYHRDRTSCNTDNPMPEDPNSEINPKTGKRAQLDVFKATSHEKPTAKVLDDMLVPSGSKPLCVSPYGVHDQVGNIDEQVVNETGRPYASGLVGGHVFGVRNACRPMTEAHNEEFAWYETGGRCCSDTTHNTKETISP